MQSYPLLQSISTGVYAGSSIATGFAAKNQADYNAGLANAQARRVLEIGRIESDRYRTLAKGVVGAQRAAYAAQGVDVGGGSPVDVGESTLEFSNLDALMIRHNAAMQAYGLMGEAEGYKAAGRQSRVKGFADAIGYSLSGGANTMYLDRAL